MSSTTPPVAPLAFDSPKLMPAKRIHGIVHVEASLDAMKPPELKRKDSLAGNILIAEGNPTRGYWIQRKIRQTSCGSVRIGFLLNAFKPPSSYNSSSSDNTDADDNFGRLSEWKVVQSSSASTYPYPHEMVAIKIFDKCRVMQTAGSPPSTKDVTVELSALEMIKENCDDEQDSVHVIGSHEILADAQNVYAIMPYHGDGTLFEYVEEFRTLDEGVACHFFRQILKGLETLQRIGLCHRGLSLHSVLLRGAKHCSLSNLGTSLRMPVVAIDGKDHPCNTSTSLLLEPQTTTGGDPQYVAPEILRGGPFNGYAVDLWAAGLMLFAMLFGNKAPFVLAAPDDRRFRNICVEGKLELVAEPFMKKRKGVHVSDVALDLIQNMLRADPDKRLSLQQVLDHPWVVGGVEDVSPPPMKLSIKNME